jgi:hypothetical protein
MTKPLNYQHIDSIAEQFIEHCTETVRSRIRSGIEGV